MAEASAMWLSREFDAGTQVYQTVGTVQYWTGTVQHVLDARNRADIFLRFPISSRSQIFSRS